MGQLKRDSHTLSGDKATAISETKNILREISNRKTSKAKDMAGELCKMKHSGFQNKNGYQ